jgi:16S rRNA (adenine1518-N6/adenine1519-N6)-dimethyltransferase
VLCRGQNKDNLIIHQGNALKFDLSTLTTPLRVVGNLPYNISSPLLFHLLENRDKLPKMPARLQAWMLSALSMS